VSGFGDRLRRARLAVGMTQDQLGFAVGLSKQAVSEWENERGYPGFTVWPKLRAALQIKLDDLICGDADKAARARGAMNITDSRPPEYKVEAEDLARARDAREFALLLRYRALEAKRQAAWLELMKP
jgi:transcriptional regulator with XRE-family HTH domain